MLSKYYSFIILVTYEPISEIAHSPDSIKSTWAYQTSQVFPSFRANITVDDSKLSTD